MSKRGRPSKAEREKEKKKAENKKTCVKCSKEQSKTANFYRTESMMFPDGRVPLCKECINGMIDYNDINTVYDVLRQIDKPFIYTIWESSLDTRNPFGNLMRQLNSLHQYKGLTWADSDFDGRKPEDVKISPGVSSGGKKKPKEEEEKVDESVQDEKPSFLNITEEELGRLMDKWGYGYSNEEYVYFERKYNTLRGNYQEKTAMHTEALLTYIRYRVKEELATAEGNVKDAKEWGNLAAKAAQDAKINPNQMSASDLLDGLDTFGQLAVKVEQAVNIIPIMPEFKERPRDKVDVVLWAYINYIRNMLGKSEVPYKDIYNYYNVRRENYEASMSHGLGEDLYEDEEFIEEIEISFDSDEAVDDIDG